MNFSPTNHRTRTGAFTFVEIMVAASVFTVVGVAVLGVLISTMQLSSENVVANMSNFRARQALDRAGEVIRYAQDTPVLINVDGTTSTTKLSDGSLVSDGVLVRNALAGLYVFKNSNGLATADIPAGATSFMIEYDTTLPPDGSGASLPVVGDCFMLDLSTKYELEVIENPVPAASVVVGDHSISRAVVKVKPSSTIQAVAQTNPPFVITATRYRKEAYVFALNNLTAQYDLHHYPRVVSGTVYADASNYVTMGTGFQKLIGADKVTVLPWFTREIVSGTQDVWLRALARSSDHGEYNEYFTGRNTLTATPVQGKLWNYDPPSLTQ